MRPASAAEKQSWDSLILANPDGGQVFQTKAWGNFKALHNWQPHFYIHDLSSGPVAVMYLVRKLPKFGEIWWAQKGPGVATDTALAELAGTLKPSTNSFMVRLNPSLIKSQVNPTILQSVGLVEAKRDVSPDKSTIIVDLSPSEDDIINSFKQKTRYNIRLAEKRGVSVTPVPPTQVNLEIMYSLLAETSSRAQFYTRAKSYYLGYWKILADAELGTLMFAQFEGQVLAGLFATHTGTKAWYKDGGSSTEHRNLMAAYLLQWETMRLLKQRGITSYDLVGVPPSDELSPENSIYSLYQFKAGFNETITDYINSYDYPVKLTTYLQWDRWGERAMSAYYMRTKRQLLY
ncbi:MAG: lipid II:glycine glycyltransferase FemX [Candidatus Saccharimonadia bacterium]